MSLAATNASCKEFRTAANPFRFAVPSVGLSRGGFQPLRLCIAHKLNTEPGCTCVLNSFEGGAPMGTVWEAHD